MTIFPLFVQFYKRPPTPTPTPHLPNFPPLCLVYGLAKVPLKNVQASFYAEAAGRALSGNDTTTMETLDALRSGLGVGGVSKNGVVTLADMERYHQVSHSVTPLGPVGPGPRLLIAGFVTSA